MTTLPFRFKVYTNLGSVYLGSLELRDVGFNDPVTGNGSFGATALMTDTQDVVKLKALINPDNFITVEYGNSILFGGPITARKWSTSKKELAFQAVSWRAWMYQIMLRINTTTYADVQYTYSAVDQNEIMRQIVRASVLNQSTPLMTYEASLSGVTRSLNVAGSEFKYVGDLIDSMAQRAGGFDWTVDVVMNSVTNKVNLRPTPYFPQRGSVRPSVVIKSTSNGGNVLNDPDYDESFVNYRSRVWATGDGQPPDQVQAYDEDPDLTAGGRMLSETVSNWSGVTNRTTLTGHARQERNYRAVPMQPIEFDLSLEAPLFTNYSTGDRVRVILEDQWLNVDFTSVRITNREFTLNRADNVDTVTVTVDLNDLEMPDVDAAGSSET